MTRREYLSRRYYEQRGELEQAMAVLRFLQHGTDSEAVELLARLRLGAGITQSNSAPVDLGAASQTLSSMTERRASQDMFYQTMALPQLACEHTMPSP